MDVYYYFGQPFCRTAFFNAAQARRTECALSLLLFPRRIGTLRPANRLSVLLVRPATIPNGVASLGFVIGHPDFLLPAAARNEPAAAIAPRAGIIRLFAQGTRP